MKTRILKIIILLVFVTGLAIFLYPYGTKWLHENSSRKVVEEFYEEVGQWQSADGGNDDSEENKTSGYTDEAENGKAVKLHELYAELESYNERLYAEGQKDLKDPFSYESATLDLTEYGLSENVIGVLWIPRLDLEQPIYMGANYENLSKGIGLLGNTSVPLGGENTNVVLAGHRGWRGIPMFRNIQSIQLGDKIQITTPWETLIYRVVELKIIPKDSTEVIYIQEGREIVTLLTCHPYTKNEQRYVVIAERSYESEVTKETDLEEADKTESAEPQQVQVVTDEGTYVENISPVELSPVLNEGMSESGTGYSTMQIWLETWSPVIGIVLVVLVGAVLWCIVGRRKKDGGK